MDWISTPILLAICGFAGGMVLGLAARLGRFCTLGAIEDAVLLSDTRRARAWLVAIATAIVGANLVGLAGFADFSNSFYLSNHVNLPAAIFGGLMFGVGMALAGTCAYGALARIGGGDLRAMVMIIVLAISAYAALNGITAAARVGLFAPMTIDLGRDQGIANILADTVPGLSPYVVGLAIAAVLAWLAFRDPGFRQSRTLILGGFGVGLAVSFGWLATGLIGADPFDPKPLESYTFVRPVGDSLIYLMTYTGASIKFGIGATFGVVAGSLSGALYQGRIRWEACDDPRELRRQILGAFFMGTGGVLALGCSVGQGVSAMSVLSLTAPVVLTSIVVGAWLTIGWLVEGSALSGPKDMVQRFVYPRVAEPGE